MLRILIILLLAFMTLPSWAIDTVSITMGQPDMDGITMPNAGDGQYVDKEIKGRIGRSPRADTERPCYYLYFRASDEFARSCKGELYITVDYLDEGFGGFMLQYQSSRTSYEVGPSAPILGTGKWQTAVLHVKNAKLERVQNNGADFRFAIMSRQPISKVIVSTKQVKGAARPFNAAKRMKEMEKEIIRPQGMEYTFGNDCDEASGLIYRRLGVSSIESYVTWESCEGKGKDQWDWSRWDAQVLSLKKTGLKWVPFLILSPAYSTPNWFRQSSDHIPCACLEHGTKSKIESLWNPNLPKYIDRFIGEFAKRYRNSGVIESVLLGIQGDFGEAIYSVTGGGWTFDIPGEYHNHAGFWCNDPYARRSFRKWLSNKYSNVEALNLAWGTSFRSLNSVDFPIKGEKEINQFRHSLTSAPAVDRRKWLDFVQWYRDSMTGWSDWWIATTRKHFPKTEIYLCTGGDAPPEHGSDFAAQCKAAAKYKAGVRITNEGSDYQNNFVMTRWVAAAGKHYGAFYGFEPAGSEDENGVAVRIYNATASGAKQLHDYSPNIVSNPKSRENQQKHLKFLKKREPEVDVALFYPNTHMTIEWGGFFDKARSLRDIVDYDYVDEGMMRDGALKHYKALVILHGNYIEKADLDIIRNWVLNGGVVVGLDLGGLKSVEGEKLTDRLVVPVIAERMHANQGTVYNVGLSWDQKDAFFQKLVEILKTEGVHVPDGQADGIFATVTRTGEVLYLNTTDKDVDKIIGNTGVSMPAHSIFSLGR